MKRITNIIYPAFAALGVACFVPLPKGQAQLPSPSPDGGYPGENTAEGDGALFSLTSGTLNTAIGFHALENNTTGNGNVANGAFALNGNTIGRQNTASGLDALQNNTEGIFNTANGCSALGLNTTGGANTAVGFQALFNNRTGSGNTACGNASLGGNTTGSGNTACGDTTLGGNGNFNIALGVSAGIYLLAGDGNIYIGNVGPINILSRTESGTIRIGTDGTHTNTYIAGVYQTNVAKGLSVVVDSTGHLGTRGSSQRFKEAIKPMDKASEAIHALKPVTFCYKHELDPDGTPQFGLIAEDVAKVNPDLVARDADGKPYSVRYEAVNAMLLNEFLKEHRIVQEQGAIIARQQKQIEALTAVVQKVSAQLELSKPEPQTVLNGQ